MNLIQKIISVDIDGASEIDARAKILSEIPQLRALTGDEKFIACATIDGYVDGHKPSRFLVINASSKSYRRKYFHLRDELKAIDSLLPSWKRKQR